MVKIFDLQREYEGLKGPLAEAFDRVCRGGEFILGREVAAFEEAFARYTGVHFAAGVGSGTDALRIGGLALGLKAGDKVVTTPNTYIATVMALSVHGIVPVFCDIDPEDLHHGPRCPRRGAQPDKGREGLHPRPPLRPSLPDGRDHRRVRPPRRRRLRGRLPGPRRPLQRAGRSAPSAAPPPSASTPRRTSALTATGAPS